MSDETLPFEILDTIVETAGLYFAEPGDGDDSYDAVRIRPSYKGRGFAPEGFGLTLASEGALRVLLAAAGMIASDQEHNELPSFDAVAFAKRTETDSMGHGIIAYWPRWTLSDIPEVWTQD